MRLILLLLVLFPVLSSLSCIPNTSQGIWVWLTLPQTPAKNQNPFNPAVAQELPENQPFNSQVYLPLVSKTEAATPIWHPQPRVSWQWDLSDEQPSTNVSAAVYDVDLYTDQRVLDELKGRGGRLICYISVGSWEEWRPDANQFPAEVLGKAYEGWPGERWLDIRQIDKLAPIMQARFDLCARKGFDAIEPDNMEVSSNDSGFAITVEDERRYALWLADQAHQRRIAIGMKNAAHLVKSLLPYFEFILTEDCFAQGWCAEARPFIERGKAVFAAEYSDEMTEAQFKDQVCPQAIAWGFSPILKNRSLDAWRVACE